MNNAPNFYGRLFAAPNVPSITEIEQLWQSANVKYDAGNYKEAILATMDYLDTTVRKVHGNPAQDNFIIPHGSSRIEIQINDENLVINAPFILLSESSRIPIMRKIAEINFDNLQLANLQIQGDRVNFHCELPLALCQPNLLYYLFRNICANSDYWDDEFVSLYGAKHIEEPMVSRYEELLLKQAYDRFRADLCEAGGYIEWFEDNRFTGYAFDMLCICLFKIDFAMDPQGKLGNDISDGLSMLRNGDIQFAQRIAQGKKLLTELESISFQTFSQDIYKATFFVNGKIVGRLEHLQKSFEYCYELAKGEYVNGDYMACSLTVIYNYLNLLFTTRLSPEVEGFITTNLKKASGTSWQEAAEVLYPSLDRLMKGDLMSPAINPAIPAQALESKDDKVNINQAIEMSKKLFSTFNNFFNN